MHSDDLGEPITLELALTGLRAAGRRLERAVEAHAAIRRAGTSREITSAASYAAAHEVSEAACAAREAFAAYRALTNVPE